MKWTTRNTVKCEAVSCLTCVPTVAIKDREKSCRTRFWSMCATEQCEAWSKHRGVQAYRKQGPQNLQTSRTVADFSSGPGVHAQLKLRTRKLWRRASYAGPLRLQSGFLVSPSHQHSWRHYIYYLARQSGEGSRDLTVTWLLLFHQLHWHVQ